MATLYFLPEHLTDRLRRSIPDRFDWYKSKGPWIDDFAVGAGWERASNVPLNLPPGTALKALLAGSDGDSQDLENSIKVHKALRALTPAQARDPRLWTRLTHVEFWSYMRSRWPAEKHAADRKKAERYVEAHYFVSRSEGRALLRNGAARLWWYAHLTHDDKRDNPYELTGVLLKNLDITQQVLERSMGRCPSVLIGFLEFLRENDALLKGGDANRTRIRALAKSLNLLGGVALLDCLAPATLKTHLSKELAAATNREKAATPQAA